MSNASDTTAAPPAVKEIDRCPWPRNEELYIRYHDEEWGTPVHDDRKHFEFLVLESAQAGLSWETVLYAHLQAVGIVNDHLVSCFRYAELVPASKRKLDGTRNQAK
jgi:3-methyladenine DNA glycosylase Tag